MHKGELTPYHFVCVVTPCKANTRFSLMTQPENFTAQGHCWCHTLNQTNNHYVNCHIWTANAPLQSSDHQIPHENEKRMRP